MKIEQDDKMKQKKYAVGVEICRLELKAVLVDACLKPVDSLKAIAADVKSVGGKCAELVQELLKKSGVEPEDVVAIGIGTEPKFFPVGKKIESKFGIKTFCGAIADYAALGEKALNADIGAVDDILYIYSDLGAGVVLKGTKVISDQLPAAPYLKPWDASFGISEIAKREAARGVGTKIVNIAEGRLDNISDAVVAKAARQNDEVALNIIHSAGVNLGLRVAYLVNLCAPKIVVLGGGFEKTEELLVEPIKNMIGKLALKSRVGSLKVISDKLGEDAACIGAASLALR